MNKKIIAVSATQGCFGINTPIRMYDGTIKMVQDIEVGDVVMGNDSTPRNVLLLHRGKEELFEFEYIDGIKHTYNKSHELILQYSQTKGKRKKGDLLIDTVANYLKTTTEMYDGEEKKVVLVCDNELMKLVIDKFGVGIKTERTSETQFKATVTVSTSKTFYAWAFRFAGQMKIIGPENVRQEYLEMARKVLE